MKNTQFSFSVFVAITLNILGGVILQVDPAGLGLIVVGTVLLLTAFATKNTQVNHQVTTL